MSKTALLLLRIGLAFSFAYAAFGSFTSPNDWIGYFPEFMRHLVSPTLLLDFFSAYEVILAVWLLTGWKTFYPAVLSALTMMGIVGSNLGAMEIVFRDVTIFFAAAALAVETYKKGK